MTEHELERQQRMAERMFNRFVAWEKDIRLCPFGNRHPGAEAHWHLLVSRHLSRVLDVVAA